MINKCSKKENGGKGNWGKFIEREHRICSAGLPSSQPNQVVKDNLKYYSLSDAVDSLIGDAIIPAPKSSKVSEQKSLIRDMRNAGIFSEGAELINPPVKTKFQTLVEDFKETAFDSYWNKEVGKISDPVPALPKGFNIYCTALGKKNKRSPSSYDIIFPIDPIPDKTRLDKEPGYQLSRKYCSFNPNLIFGQKSNSDRSGKLMKCCLNVNKADSGIKFKIPLNEKQAHHQGNTNAKLGVPLFPNNNIDSVPEGFAFGKVEPSDDNLVLCLKTYETNPYKEFLKKCLEHLNTLRKCLSKRFDGSFFNKFYLCLKYLDDSKCGWLDKQVIYNHCSVRYIRFNPSLIEPLLEVWNSIKQSNIDYKMFTRIINYREPTPDLPKLQDIPPNLIDYCTTYSEIGNFHGITDKNARAGIPSGRYFDQNFPITSRSYCKADEYYLPDETDMRACLCPSIFTLLGVSHRDMYAKRDPVAVKRLFENAGEKFDDEKFEMIWNNAKAHHSQGWVCYETFRRFLNEYNNQK